MNIVDSSGNTISSDSDVVKSLPVESTTSERLKPRQIGFGNTRGAQTIGYGNTKIDGINNRISVGVDDSALNLGDLSNDNSAFGLNVLDDNGEERLSLGKTAENQFGFMVPDDTETPRLFAGKFPDGSVKIKLSQSSHDVTTATDDQLIWSSDFNLFKVVRTGTLTLPLVSVTVAAAAGMYSSTTSSSTPVAHGLGYKPSIVSFVEDSSFTGTDGLPALSPMNTTNYSLFIGGGGGIGIISRRIFVDDTYVFAKGNYYVLVNGSGFAGTYTSDAVTIRYYLLRETAN